MSTRSIAKFTTAGLALAAIVSLAGCGGHSAGVSASSFPNPVDIIKKANCTPPDGVTMGTAGLDGEFMVADCTYPSDMAMRVMTFKTNAARDSHLTAFPNQDGRAVIVGDKFLIDLEAPVDMSTDGSGGGFTPAPELVRIAVGGRIQ